MEKIANQSTLYLNLISQKYISNNLILSSSPPDFNKFIHESIKDKIKTDPTSNVIGT